MTSVNSYLSAATKSSLHEAATGTEVEEALQAWHPELHRPRPKGLLPFQNGPSVKSDAKLPTGVHCSGRAANHWMTRSPFHVTRSCSKGTAVVDSS